jgi:hypothetical protein
MAAAKRRMTRRDPMEAGIEAAFRPGWFIDYRDNGLFLNDLYRLAEEIAQVKRTDPARAVTLYETLLAGCHEKAEEIDDSDGALGAFAGSLYCGWVQARQAAGSDRAETAKLLLAFLDDDEYGFSNNLEREAATVFDRQGLEAFELEVRARFDRECTAPNSTFDRNRWGRSLKSIYLRQRKIDKYVETAERTGGLTRGDCEAVATICEAKRKLADALGWVERGLGIKQTSGYFEGGGNKLGDMRRALLVKLGRSEEARESAWVEFQAHPSTSTYKELLRYIPKAQHPAWREKAMVAAAEKGGLSSLIELWLHAKEIERLAERLDRATDRQLESLSHYTTEPAAKRLEKTHPAVAAKVFRALCMRIVDAGKSNYYGEALLNLEKAKECYRRAGLDSQWQALAAQIRRDHSRKTSFMPGFERIAQGAGPSKEPSFLDRARDRWPKRG